MKLGFKDGDDGDDGDANTKGTKGTKDTKDHKEVSLCRPVLERTEGILDFGFRISGFRFGIGIGEVRSGAQVPSLTLRALFCGSPSVSPNALRCNAAKALGGREFGCAGSFF
jgi:hypothetical protein